MEPSEEYSYVVDPSSIDGTVPEELKGTMYRAGPGRIRIGEHKFGHWFDGDGMVGRKKGFQKWRNDTSISPAIKMFVLLQIIC